MALVFPIRWVVNKANRARCEEEMRRRRCRCVAAASVPRRHDQGCRRRTCCHDKERWQTWAGFPVSLLSLILCWRRWRRDLEWQAALLALHRGGTAEARLGSSATSLLVLLRQSVTGVRRGKGRRKCHG
nr:hypothetical protein Iba_chr10eCG9520 [Ipomoea batatas]